MEEEVVKDNNAKEGMEEHDDVGDEVEVEGPQNVGGFTVLGDFKPKEKKKVSRVLPNWLRHPMVIPEDSGESHKFSQIQGLDAELLQKLEDKGLTDCFPVQWLVLPELLSQCACGLYAGDAGLRPRDVCVSAPTGSGKTLTFALPIIQALQGRVVPHIRAVVVLPVRDLALQVFKVFEEYTQNTGLKVVLLAGKKDFSQEQRNLVMKRPSGIGEEEVWSSVADIVVATRGRLLDHIDCTEGFDLTHVRFLVIDEADRQMEELHSDWLDQIEAAIHSKDRPEVQWAYQGHPPLPLTLNSCKQVKKYPQKLLFSATLSQNAELLERLNLFLPLLYTTAGHRARSGLEEDDVTMEVEASGDKFSTPSTLQEKYLDCKTSEKPLLLFHFILHKKFPQVLCFANTVEAAHRLYLLARQMPGVKVAELSSNVHTVKRERIIRRFARGTLQLLICSDVMARGIDIENVQYVISYDAPLHVETYIHRVGRTARAHKAGTAITFLEGKEMFHFKRMLRESGRWSKMTRVKVNPSQLQPLVPHFTSALKALPDILKEQRQKKKKL